ncbi:MAG: hypothetical protein M1434_14930 [Chloroflexi bacterium]|nr:hypothetical protein [Chloroflexota bacterium]MCL5276014.1 hypothetical protein [Chloroflexota bacterium]
MQSLTTLTHNLNSLDKTLDRNSNTIRNNRAAIRISESSPDEPGYLWNAGHHWADYDAGAVALDRERRQLSKHPAVISERTALESDPVALNPELVRIQTALQTLLETVNATIRLKYVVMDGHFGNNPSASMIRHANPPSRQGCEACI